MNIIIVCMEIKQFLVEYNKSDLFQGLEIVEV
jgi:hypothetical protein